MGRTDAGNANALRRVPALAGCGLLALLLGAVWLRPLPTGATQAPEAAGWAEPVVADGVAYVGVWLDPGGDLLLALDAATGAERWRFRVDHTLIAAPTVLDGVVYVGDDAYARDRDLDRVDGTVYALDAATGAERWRASTDRGVRASPVVVGGVVYVVDGFSDPGLRGDGTVYALDADTGGERWRAAVGEATCSAPAVADGVVYVRSGSTAPTRGADALHALDATTGDERWRFAAAGPCVGGAPAALADDTVYVHGADADLYALDTVGGVVRWRAVGGGPEPVNPVAAGGVILSVGGGSGAEQTAVVAVDAASGAERWRVPLEWGAVSPPDVVGNIVYVQTLFEVVALDATNGGERWRADGGFVAAPVVGEVVYVGGEVSDLIALDAATGSPRWHVAPPGIELRLVAATDDLVFLTGGDDLLRALDPATGRVRWSFALDTGTLLAAGRGAMPPAAWRHSDGPVE